MAFDPTGENVSLAATIIHRSGVILLSPDGAVFWCDTLAADILGRNVTGLFWADLFHTFQKYPAKAGALPYLPEAVADVQQVIAARITVTGTLGKPVEIDISLAPVTEAETAVLKQVVLTLTPVQAMTEMGKFGSAFRSAAEHLSLSDICKTGLHGAILRATRAGFLILGRNGVIRDVNSAAGELLEIDLDARMSRILYDVLPEPRRLKWQSAVQSVLAIGQEKTFVETWGGTKHYQIDLLPVLQPGGQIENVVAAIRDITDQWVCEIRYRELYQHMGRGALICESSDNGLTFTVKDLNSSALVICDRAIADAVGRTVSEVMPGIEKSGLLEVMYRVYTSNTEERMPSFFEPGFGRRVWLDISIFTLPNRELVVIFEDITAKYETELILRRSKEEWEKTFDAISDIVTIQDPYMRIVRANKAAYTMFGLKFGELIGKKCYEIFQGFDEPCEGCPVVSTCQNRCIDNGLIYNVKLGKTIDVRSSPIFDESGELKWLVQIGRDVTLSLQQESERRLLSAAIEQASESVVITDRDGVLQYVNPAFCETTGYTREESVGQKADILKSGVHDHDFYTGMWSRLLRGKVWRGRLTNRKKDSSLFKEDATISPVVDSFGRITNYIALKRDITWEDSLERQLQQAMKMEAIGTLAGGIAHDFNNILSAIIGYGYIAKGKLDKASPVHGDLDQILAGGDRAADLVKQILTFARQETKEQFRPLKLQYIIKEVLKLLRSSLPATIELRQFVDNSCGSIMADPGQMHQLLMNLCTNAKQAIGATHGVISIRLGQHLIGDLPGIENRLAAISAKYLTLTVEDTGCGMDPLMLERIFDPFFTTRAKEHGTGLGLAVVHGIVKKHQGEITVESEAGKGTVFKSFFPVVDQEAIVFNEIRGPEYRGSERIMVVDDEITVGSVHEKMLSKLGYRVSLYSNSLEAVKRFRENPNCCDLVLTDMTMPNMTGAELAREMLTLRPDLPIIMITGYSETVDKEKAVRIGIRDFILKPVSKAELSVRIREVLKSGAHSHS